jgi:sirohydrochlorin cobaltochelatase
MTDSSHSFTDPVPTARADATSRPGHSTTGDDRPLGPPLLIVGHGSRTTEGTHQFLAFTRRVAARARGRAQKVVGGFMELAHPDVAEAVTGLRESVPGLDGAVVALPLMLSAGGHAKHDIPALLATVQADHGDIDFRYGKALGPHPVLVKLLAARVDAVLGDVPAADTHVVLVGRGGSDPEANSDVAKVARLLGEARGFAQVEVAFEAATGPTVPQTLDRYARYGATRIVVAPYLLFPGIVADRIAEHVRDFAAAHPKLDVRAADVLGDCDELADLVLARYEETVATALEVDTVTEHSRHLRSRLAHDHHPPHSHGHGSHHEHDHSRSLPEGSRSRTVQEPDIGVVTLVGAGPGATDLLTLRGARALARADVVFTDRLVPQELLAALRPEVDVINVGKTPRRPSTYQDDINDLLIAQARAGRNVVRLKGGDPYVFGRGFEEYAACLLAGVPCEVVPGISSALAAPALAGISVTHRGLVHDLCVVTGHVPPGDPNSRTDWASLARLEGTLVIMMGINHAAKIASVLIEHGREGHTPIAVVENAATAHQRVARGRLDELGHLITAENIRPPATIVIGAVTALIPTDVVTAPTG